MTYQFDDLGDKTKLTMTHRNATGLSEQEAMGVTAGWNSNFDCLVDYIPTLLA